MNKIKFYSLLILGMLFLSAGMISCDETEVTPDPEPIASLTQEEENSLLFMREEEKLARDVYLYFHEQYNLQIFKNISESEETHMGKVLELIEFYELEDPAAADEGVFNNSDLQQLYDELIDAGSNSLVDALKVGATIEDVDIYDLQEAVTLTDKENIINIYDMLTCGSTNHMRAFVNQLENNGATYTPQYITQEQYDEILAGEHQHCGQ